MLNLMDKKTLQELSRHLKGAMNAFNNLTSGKKSCNDVKECGNCSCKNADRLAKHGHPDADDSVGVIAVDSGDKQSR